MQGVEGQHFVCHGLSEQESRSEVFHVSFYLSWMMAVACGSACSAYRHFQLLEAKECQIENLKVKQVAFLIFSQPLRPLESCATLIKSRWKHLPEMKWRNETWNVQYDANKCDPEGTRGEIIYWIVVISKMSIYKYILLVLKILNVIYWKECTFRRNLQSKMCVDRKTILVALV